jgi:hypothetical protein
VNLTPGDEQRALDELKASGIAVVESSEIVGDARLRV